MARSKREFMNKLGARHPYLSAEVVELSTEARFQTKLCAFEILTPPKHDYNDQKKILSVPTLLAIGRIEGIISTKLARKLSELNGHVKIDSTSLSRHPLKIFDWKPLPPSVTMC